MPSEIYVSRTDATTEGLSGMLAVLDAHASFAPNFESVTLSPVQLRVRSSGKETSRVTVVPAVSEGAKGGTRLANRSAHPTYVVPLKRSLSFPRSFVLNNDNCIDVT